MYRSKYSIYWALLVLCCIIPAIDPSPGYAQADTVLSRYREYLFRTYEYEPDSVKRWAESLDRNGQWADVDYRDRERAAWKTPDHLKRVRQLAFAWASPKSPYYRNEAIRQKAVAGLDHWLAKRYQNPNWWHNEIGVPQFMRDILILLQGGLPPDRFKPATEVLAQLRVQGPGHGANLIWSADLGLHYGLLVHDGALVQRCRDLLLGEIHINTGEGIQPDYSYHQHGKRLQMFQYGAAFLQESSRIAWQLRGTTWAFPEEKTRVLTDLVLNGWQWMARGIHTVPGTMDRSSSRVGELKSPDLRPLIPFLMELQPQRAEQFKRMAAIQDGSGALEGFRYYPYSDFAAYHRPGFTFFLKTISTRTLATESINSENLKGKLLNSGDAYLIRNGREYFDLMPVWDYMALPGVTAFEGAHAVDRRAFVGSVSDGMSGLSAMDYVLESSSKAQSLSARKIWACHGNAVVCLIADLRTRGIRDEVYTALDQARVQGAVTVDEPGSVLGSGNHHLRNVRWLHHAGFAYIPLQPADMEVQVGEVAGTWTSINVAEPADTIRERVFLPRLVHDMQEQGGSAAYVLAYAPTPDEARRLARRPEWRVLRNDRDVQAVRFGDGTLMVAFFAPGRLEIGRKEYLRVDKPCLLLMEGGELFASDPTNEGGRVRVEWSGRSQSVDLPPNGLTIRVVGQ